MPFIANRSHLLAPFDILAHSPVHDKQYLTTTINYMLPVAAYKSHNQFSSSGVLRSRCEHSHDPIVERLSSLNPSFLFSRRKCQRRRDMEGTWNLLIRWYSLFFIFWLCLMEFFQRFRISTLDKNFYVVGFSFCGVIVICNWVNFFWMKRNATLCLLISGRILFEINIILIIKKFKNFHSQFSPFYFVNLFLFSV